MVLEGLPVDIKDELTDLIVEINSGFDTADLVIENYRENRSGCAEGNA